MNITQATAWAMVIAGFISPAIVQLVKKYIPAGWTEGFAIGISIVLGATAVAATGGFDHTTWGVALVGVIGVAQVVYAAMNKALGNGLSKGTTENKEATNVNIAAQTAQTAQTAAANANSVATSAAMKADNALGVATQAQATATAAKTAAQDALQSATNE